MPIIHFRFYGHIKNPNLEKRVFTFQKWEKTNKNGSRDKRYADNRELPLMRYSEITFYKKAGIFEKFMFSNYEYSERFISDINYFIDTI